MRSGAPYSGETTVWTASISSWCSLRAASTDGHACRHNAPSTKAVRYETSCVNLSTSITSDANDPDLVLAFQEVCKSGQHSSLAICERLRTRKRCGTSQHLHTTFKRGFKHVKSLPVPEYRGLRARCCECLPRVQSRYLDQKALVTQETR